MKFAFALLAAVATLLSTTARVFADPYLGFVTVPGALHSDDLGPDPRIMGEALRYSAATCVAAGLDQASVYPLLGRFAVGYTGAGASVSDISAYNALGFSAFIYGNEPDGTAGTNPNWAQDYMNQLNASYPVIKGVNAANQVIGGNLAGSNFAALYTYGLKTSSDIIGFHCYSNDPATGINVNAVQSVRNTMVSNGDGAKKIFLGEGWGPMRELPGLTRLFPDAPITAGEIDMLRNFVVNGYWNIVTKTSSYDPNWVLGVLFFTMNDNWGGGGWAARAKPHYDGSGNVLYYTVDGYNVGLDIFPHFYNGGLVDIMGNAKDNLMDIFPGKGLALSNSGFEYFDASTGPIVAADWTSMTLPPPANRYAIDASVSHGGRQSQRITLDGSTSESIFQNSLKASVTPGLAYSASVWIKTSQLVKGSGTGAGLWLQFINPAGWIVGYSFSSSITGTSGWTKVMAAGTAPANTDHLRVTCAVSGSSGTAWFDDACAWQGSSPGTSTLSGYVVDDSRNSVSGATVVTTTGGYSGKTGSDGHFVITGVEPGVYDLTASGPGVSARTVRAQLALPNKTRALGFADPAMSPNVPTGVMVQDPAVGGLLHVSWANPTGAFDYVRVYRSADPSQLGTLAYDHVTANSVWDSGVQDGVKYSYTVRSVKSGVESTNNDHYYGISSGGSLTTAYSAYSSAIWGQWANSYGQTFVANATGSIASASCMPGFGSGGGGTNLTFAIFQGGPGGAQVGPSASKWAAGDQECTVTWNAGQIPVQSGQTYYLKVTGSSGFAAYRGSEVYGQGTFYINDVAQSGSDMWSTIRIVRPAPVWVSSVAASVSGPKCTVTWNTVAPATSQVEYGTTASYGTLSALDSAPTTDHSVTIAGLDPNTFYHFRVRSQRTGIPEAVSLDYTFTSGSPVLVDVPYQAKLQADGTYVSLSGVVCASFPDFFYLESPDRASGIRVQMAASGLSAGVIASVQGVMQTSSDGERYIDASGAAASGSATVAPLCMVNSAVGGGADGALASLQQGVSGAQGLNNIGLLVSTWGSVTFAGLDYFYVDDGSALQDGSGNTGVRVVTFGVASPPVGSLVEVTGASSCFSLPSGLQRQILLPSVQDVTVLG